MKILVIGAGAMGCLFGGMLQEAGHEVQLADIWQEHVDAINANGLIIELDGRHRTVRIPACQPSMASPGAHLLVVFTKAFHTQEALSGVGHALNPDSYILTLQNGVGHVDIISRFVDAKRIIHGITTYPCDLVGPGKISMKKEGYIKMMSVDGRQHSFLDELDNVFRGAGLESSITPGVQVAIWEKLAFNCVMNSLCAILRLTVGQLGDSPDGRRLVNAIVDEAVAVAYAKGISVDRPRIALTLAMAFEKHRDHKPSMLQDVLKQRRTEIDFINGAVVREGAILGIDTRVNDTLCKLVKTLERSYLR